MQLEPATPEVRAPRRRDLPTPRALVPLPIPTDEELLRFGGLDPEVRIGVQRELELLLAPIVPMLMELALWLVAGSLGPLGPALQREFGASVYEAASVTALLLALALLVFSHALALAWVWRWSRGHRAAPLVFVGGVALVSTPRLLGVASASPLISIAVALLVIVGYPLVRSLTSPRYCLARLVAFEQRAGALEADPFTFDTRVLFGLGIVMLPFVWLVRFLSRPFILPAADEHRARLIWPERE